MKVFMTGGTGFVGTTLTRGLAERGHRVTVLTRSIGKERVLPPGARLLEGNPTERGPWQEEMARHDILINLAGASIFRRWSDKTKKVIRDSRILSTRNLVEALSARGDKETLFFSTSAVGYYGFRGDEELDEGSAPGEGFLSSVTREWEAEALKAQRFGARVLLCRFGIVLGSGGGALAKMLPLFKWYLGAPIGSGRQWVSWIHEQDLVNIYLFLMEANDFSGPVNFTAPHPVRNSEMTRLLGEALKRPTFMPPVPGFVIRLLMGEFASVLLEGQRAITRRLPERGFQFQFGNLREGLVNLLGQ